MDFRALGLVVFFLMVAFVGVVAVRSASVPVPWVEQIPPQGQPTSEHIRSGLTLAVRGSTLKLSVSDCAVEKFSEQFFLHIFPYQKNGAVGEQFINLDFYLGKERGKKRTEKGGTVCEYSKALGRNIGEVVVGQFSQPQGRCCKILWSRTFHPAPR